MLSVTQVAQGTVVVSQVVAGDASAIHGLEVVPLVTQHLQAVLLHTLIVHQLGLQQARCTETGMGRKESVTSGLLCIPLKNVAWFALFVPV